MKYNIAIVGASGLVGETVIKILEERKIEYNNLVLFASKRSAGQEIIVNEKSHIIIELSEENIRKQAIDFVIFAASAKLSEQFSPIFVEENAIVIDNSSHFRMDPKVPLIVPEVNPHALDNHKGIIANPNCSTIQSLMALKVIDDLFKVQRVLYTTYQSVSGSGTAGINDLKNKTKKNYPHYIHHNIIPHIDDFLENKYTKEEMKMIDESKKILNNPNLKISATCARVPIMNTHAVSMIVECENEIDIELLSRQYDAEEGIVLCDDIFNNQYPLAENASGKDDVYIGRIRQDLAFDNAISLWTVADNIRKGAAGNSIDILELLIKKETM